MNYSIKIAAFIVWGVFLLIGCGTTLHKDFRFESLEKKMKWGVLHAKLRGKQADAGRNLTITGSPYELLIWFSTEDNKTFKDCVFFLDSLTLIRSDTGKNVLTRDNSKTQFKKKSDGSYSASFIFENIELEYVDYSFQILFHGSTQCRSIFDVSQVEFVFHRDYQEKNISFWDTMMGI